MPSPEFNAALQAFRDAQGAIALAALDHKSGLRELEGMDPWAFKVACGVFHAKHSVAMRACLRASTAALEAVWEVGTREWLAPETIRRYTEAASS